MLPAATPAAIAIPASTVIHDSVKISSATPRRTSRSRTASCAPMATRRRPADQFEARARSPEGESGELFMRRSVASVHDDTTLPRHRTRRSHRACRDGPYRARQSRGPESRAGSNGFAMPVAGRRCQLRRARLRHPRSTYVVAAMTSSTLSLGVVADGFRTATNKGCRHTTNFRARWSARLAIGVDPSVGRGDVSHVATHGARCGGPACRHRGGAETRSVNPQPRRVRHFERTGGA